MNPLKWPISCIAGVAVIVFFCVFTFTSWALYPTSYSPVDNWLSDLGNSTSNPNGAIVYNVGCALTGIALFPFFMGLYKWHMKEDWRKILLIVTQVVGVLAAFSLIMIGVFSEDFPEAHYMWSSVFFLLNLVVLVLLGITLFTHPEYMKPIAYYGFAVAIINLLFLLMYNAQAKILEWFTVFTALGYVGLLVYNMLKQEPAKHTHPHVFQTRQIETTAFLFFPLLRTSARGCVGSWILRCLGRLFRQGLVHRRAASFLSLFLEPSPQTKLWRSFRCLMGMVDSSSLCRSG